MVLRIAYSDKKEDYICCIFQPAFGCCAPQALVKICNMNVFNGKMLKKGEKSKNLDSDVRRPLFMKAPPLVVFS